MFRKLALWRSTRGRYSAASPCGPKHTEVGLALVQPGGMVTSTGAPVGHGEPCKMGKCAFLAVKGWVLKGPWAGGGRPWAGRAGQPWSAGRPWADRTAGQTARSPPGPRGEPRKAAKVRPEKRGGVPGVRPPCSRGCLCRLRRGCLRVGTRVRMESRVVGSAGFLPGTPAGAQGSPGARGEPGNMALLPSTLRTFFCIRTQKDM